MPAFLEAKLRSEYAAKGKKGRALDRAVYGTMNTIGAMRGSKITAKGKRMEKKHAAKVGHEKMRKLSELA
jgi:hypothetical protein